MVMKVMKQKSLSTMTKSKTVRKTQKTSTKRAAGTAAADRIRQSPRLRDLCAVVINLDNRPDRLAALQRSRAKNAPWLKLQRLTAVDGRVTKIPCKDVVKTWSTARLAQMFHWYRDKKIQMSPGERGCCASHLKAWRQCAKSGKPLLVLEDDAVILPTFTSTLTQALKELPKGCWCIVAHQQGSWHSKASREGAHATALPVDNSGLHHLARCCQGFDIASPNGYACGQFHGLACEGAHGESLVSLSSSGPPGTDMECKGQMCHIAMTLLFGDAA